MLGKTHMIIGVASSLAITVPKTAPEFLLAVGLGAAGAVISDIDVETSNVHRNMGKVLLLTIVAAAAIFGLDIFLKTEIIHKITEDSHIHRIIAGCLIFLVVCVFGKEQPHRSFMHSFLALVRKSPVLRDVAKYLGRFREIFAQGKRNGYAYGRGEKYSLELGRDLSRALTSELAMLATPQTAPLFLRKYQRGQIKQYQRREPIYKGMGDIICCLDESDSTEGDPAAWGKAVALTLLEIAADSGRDFALIHFSGPGSFKADVFQPGEYTMEDKMRAAETFLGGGTDFQTPMEQALLLMELGGFENADIVFITDGECKLPDKYLERLQAEQAARRFTVTGVLLDKGSPGMTFSLEKFCQNIYRTSELLGDEIVQELVRNRV